MVATKHPPLLLLYGHVLLRREDVKEAAYKGMVHPILEYDGSVWDPYTDKLQEE